MKNIDNKYNNDSRAIIYNGSCLDFVKNIPNSSMQLIVTSPPYNIGKEYEKKVNLDKYYKEQEKIIDECVRILDERGSICWQVGNYVDNSEIMPIDILLFPIFKKHRLHLRNRIIWYFGHGLHASKRFSGRYETILWFTKTDEYIFNLDPVRIPQKYPQKKYFKGPKAGQLSCNPIGKNPSDIWEIPNVKNNHIEKTIHPCQFPVELIERLILSMTNENDNVFDPFIGVGTTAVAAVKNKRRGIGCEIIEEYYKVAIERTKLALEGKIKTRPMNKPLYDPNNPKENINYENDSVDQFTLFDSGRKQRIAQ